MDEQEWLAERFEAERPHLRAVAYRMLGSLSEAEDAVQEAWLRLSRSDAEEIDNLGGWLTTVVARISLNTLRARRSRPEAAMTPRFPDPVVDPESGTDPEHQALIADSVGLDPDVVLVADGGEARPDITRILRGAHRVASEAFLFRSLSPYVRPALVNGAAGVVVAPEGKPFAVMGFTVVDGRIVEIDAIGDPERLAGLDLTVLEA
jgi:DNA-directed RNA polymerase specialized sigma24 family protein